MLKLKTGPLPFVKDLGNYSRDCWDVEPTGETGKDCAMGKEFAQQALDHMNARQRFDLLGWSVIDIIAKGKRSEVDDDGFVLIAFMAEIAQHAAYGWKIMKAAEEEQAGTTIAIMKDSGNGLLLGAETAFPEAEIRRPV